jgi:hypothetical protein
MLLIGEETTTKDNNSKLKLKFAQTRLVKYNRVEVNFVFLT